jgi:hypothetical protein
MRREPRGRPGPGLENPTYFLAEAGAAAAGAAGVAVAVAPFL